MASDDPKRQDAASSAPSEAASSPADIEAAVARLSPESQMPQETEPEGPAPDAAPLDTQAPEAPADQRDSAARVTGVDTRSTAAPATPETEAPAAVPVSAPAPAPRREGPSPWLALPIGALAGALAAGAVCYGLLETGMLKPPGGGDMQAVVARLTALEQRPQPNLAPLDERLAKLEAAAPALAEAQRGTAAAQAEIATLKQNLAALTASASQSATLAQQAAALSGQVATLAKTVQDRGAASVAFDRALGAVVTLGALRDALASGRPFAAELDAVKGLLGPGAAPLDPYAGAAAKGYPTPVQAAARLQAAARAPSAGEAPADAGGAGGFMGRILSSAESLVKVQPADGAPRASDQKALDAAAAALAAGDGPAAQAALDTLSPETKAKVKDIAAEVTARRDAVQAASTLYQQALAAISGKLP